MSTSIRARFKRRFFVGLFVLIPFFRGLYISIKHIVDALSSESKNSSFKQFVIGEYPRPGVFAFGFLTNECILKKEKDAQESCLRVVYIPTNLIYFGDISLFRDEEGYNTNYSHR